jgi:polysaccharide export outer membrane protein
VRLAVVTAIACAAGLASCASYPEGRFVWVDHYEPPASVPSDAIGPGDVLDVRVLGQEQLSAKVRVRDDGNITLPFLNDLHAAGRTAADVRGLVESGLKEYVNTPVVTVAIDKAQPEPVLILGEVARPGKYPFEPGMGMLQALALAGGLTEYAHKDRLYVLRGSPQPTRIRFDLRWLMLGEGRGPSFTLQPGDAIVAE